MKDIILMCKVCKVIIKTEFESEYFYLRLFNRDLAKHLKECNSQFLDIDNQVKSCFQAYIEQLIYKYKYVLTPHNQPERSKREDSNCFMDCKRSMCDGWDNCICGDHIHCKIEMRCSEHCGNTVREAQ
jgi:hypothetical protein